MSGITVTEYEVGRVSNAPASVIGLGLFDGVHIGHRALIREVVRRAAELGVTPAIFTFHLETEGLKPGAPRIYGEKERLRLLDELGIKLVYIASFSSLSVLSPEKFASGVLVDELNCISAVSGLNFRFGKGATGTSAMLSEIMTNRGREARIIDDEQINGETVSSTRIRTFLSDGDVETAAELLGAPYLISGEVKRGRGDGKVWGFPTINTELRADTPLRNGVYATAVVIDGAVYGGVTNLGTCPSFGEREIHAETMILDFNGDLYGRVVDIHLISFIRDERSFSSPEELKERIELDTALARERIRTNKWLEIGQR